MKKVKINNNYFDDDMVGLEFLVENENDGFYTDYAFYQGWITLKDGYKIYYGIEQKYCEVLEWD